MALQQPMSSSPRPAGNPPFEPIVSLACRAPSMHNTQPWLWQVDGDVLELRADYSRQLVHADPEARDLLLSCGAALHHFQVAAAGLGWTTRVRRLPDPGDPHLVARLTVSPMPASPEAVIRLSALTIRATDRRRFASWPLPVERLHALTAVGALWGAQVLPIESEAVRAALTRLVRRAAELQVQDPAYVEELAAWVRRAGDGIAPERLPAPSAPAADDPVSRFPPGLLDDPLLEEEPGGDQMMMICTSTDQTIARIRAGEALSAVWLRAVEEGLSVIPLSQALEVEETRRTIRSTLLGELAVPQMLLRIGWHPRTRTPLPATPRRSLTEVLHVRTHG